MSGDYHYPPRPPGDSRRRNRLREEDGDPDLDVLQVNGWSERPSQTSSQPSDPDLGHGRNGFPDNNSGYWQQDDSQPEPALGYGSVPQSSALGSRPSIPLPYPSPPWSETESYDEGSVYDSRPRPSLSRAYTYNTPHGTHMEPDQATFFAGHGYHTQRQDNYGQSQAGPPEPSYDESGYDQPCYDHSHHDQAGFERTGYERAVDDQAGYSQTGHNVSTAFHQQNTTRRSKTSQRVGKQEPQTNPSYDYPPTHVPIHSRHQYQQSHDPPTRPWNTEPAAPNPQFSYEHTLQPPPQPRPQPPPTPPKDSEDPPSKNSKIEVLLQYKNDTGNLSVPGLNDSANHLGPMIALGTFFKLGFRRRDIDGPPSLFTVIGNTEVPTFGTVWVEYRVVIVKKKKKEISQPRRVEFHVVKETIDKYEVLLPWWPVERPGPGVAPIVASGIASAKKMTEAELRIQEERFAAAERQADMADMELARLQAADREERRRRKAAEKEERLRMKAAGHKSKR